MKWIIEKVFIDIWLIIRCIEGDVCSKVKYYFLWNCYLNNYVYCFSLEWYLLRKVFYKK